MFAFCYAEMPGKKYVAVHELKIREDAKPIKQAQRRFHPLLMEKIEKEVQKLRNIGFIFLGREAPGRPRFAHSAPLSALTLTLYSHALRVKKMQDTKYSL